MDLKLSSEVIQGLKKNFPRGLVTLVATDEKDSAVFYAALFPEKKFLSLAYSEKGRGSVMDLFGKSGKFDVIIVWGKDSYKVRELDVPWFVPGETSFLDYYPKHTVDVSSRFIKGTETGRWRGSVPNVSEIPREDWSWPSWWGPEPRKNSPWTKAEEKQLYHELQYGMSFKRIAKTHGRGVGGINSRVATLVETDPRFHDLFHRSLF